MELRQILNLIGKWAWLIIISVVIAAGSSYFASRASTPLYRTKTTLMVGLATRNPETSSSDLYTGQQLAYTYSQLATREPVLKGAIESLGLEMSWQVLAGKVSTSIVPNTQLLEISVIDSDPYRAKVLADAIAQQLILQSPAGSTLTTGDEIEFIQEQISELKGRIETGQAELKRLRQDLDNANSAIQIQDLQNQIGLLETKITGWQNTYSQLLFSVQGSNVNALNVVEEATIPGYPISPNIPMNVMVASAIGLALAVGSILLMEFLDDTIKTPADLERVTGLPTIGTITKIDGKTYPNKLVAAGDLMNPVLEDFRTLRNNILYSTSKKSFRMLLITSTTPGEGKSICIANLAVVMATMGQRVILVDSDFRRASQNSIFNLPNETGLSTAIQTRGSKVSQYLQDVGIANLKVLTSGPMPDNPNLLFESEQMHEILQEFKTQADVVLFDSPPILVVADAVTLGTMVDGVILVVEAGSTHADEIRHVVAEMRRIHVPFIGAVLNRFSHKKKSYYYHYYLRTEARPASRRPGRRLTGLNRRRKKALPSSEALQAVEPAPPAVSIEPLPAAPGPNGPSGVRRKRSSSKKAAPAEAQPARQDLLPADASAETQDEVILEIKKSLLQKS
jgi:non-specific protein-tyrosine kinase